LTNSEWATIRTIKDFLKKLLMSIVARESKTFTLDFTLLTTDYILLQFEKHKRLYTNDAIFAPIFNSG